MAPSKATEAHDYINWLHHPEVTEATSESPCWHNSRRRQEPSAGPLGQSAVLMSRRFNQGGAKLLITHEAAAIWPRTDLSIVSLARAARRLRGAVPQNNWARAALKRRESINNQTKPEDMFLQHLGILPQQIMQTSSGNSLPICM